MPNRRSIRTWTLRGGGPQRSLEVVESRLLSVRRLHLVVDVNEDVIGHLTRYGAGNAALAARLQTG